VVFSFPPRNAVSRAFLAMQNTFFRVSRREFRVFAHPPAAMLGVLADRGLSADVVHRGRVWRVAAATR
jgi:magnesium-protoporphyrin O-methyltransferase